MLGLSAYLHIWHRSKGYRPGHHSRLAGVARFGAYALCVSLALGLLTAKKAQAACLGRDGNAMTTAISDSLRHRSQLAPAAADITTYCKAP